MSNYGLAKCPDTFASNHDVTGYVGEKGDSSAQSYLVRCLNEAVILERNRWRTSVVLVENGDSSSSK
jgi:hypothetical protein